MNKTVHQCAWCKTFMVNGKPVAKSRIIPNSHGICIKCKKKLEGKYYKKNEN